jgi:hypothetical protein
MLIQPDFHMVAYFVAYVLIALFINLHLWTHPPKKFIEKNLLKIKCSSVLLFNSYLWTQGYLHQTRKKRVLYCKFYLQFTHSAVQKGKIQLCWMTKTLYRKDWLKHFTTRFWRVILFLLSQLAKCKKHVSTLLGSKCKT